MVITILSDGDFHLPVGWSLRYCSEEKKEMRLPNQAAGAVVEAAEPSHKLSLHLLLRVVRPTSTK